jgi:ATP-binding cassette subfamily C protein CydCD
MSAVRPLDPRLLRFARSARTYLALTAGVGLGTGVLVVCQAFLLASGITAVFVDGQGPAEIGGLVSALLIVVAARAVLAWLQEALAQRTSATVKSELRGRLLASVVDAGPMGLDDRRRSDLALLATRGLDALDGYFAKYLPQLALAVMVPAVVVVVVATQDVLSAVVIAVTLPLIPVFMALIGWSTQRAQRRQWRSLQLLGGYFLDVVEGLTTLKVFGRAKAQAAGLRAVGDQYRRTTMKVLRVSFLSSFALELLATLSVALVAVEIGVRLVEGGLTLFTGLFVLLLAPEAYLPMRMVGLHFHASQEGLTAAEHVFDLLESDRPPSGAAPAPDLRGATIEVDSVSVVRPGRDHPALDHATLVVRPGRTVALVGPSGSGKSTLLAVLLGLVPPTSGVVRWREPDGSGSLGDVDIMSWRQQIAWVPQRPHFFAGTVADNVRLAAPDATDDQVAAALADAGADFADELPLGVDTVLGDGGAGLSAGQRQRLALARAFVRDSPLVLLDEPTAGLDGETEQTVVDTIRRLARDRSVVVVAHRPALVAVADEVVALAGREVPA